MLFQYIARKSGNVPIYISREWNIRLPDVWQIYHGIVYALSGGEERSCHTGDADWRLYGKRVWIAKKLYAKSNNITEFLNLLNEADIDGKNLHISGDKIIAVYKKCYCNIPKKVENLNKNYCECSAGWYMRLFSEVFEKNVNVEIVDTIVNGASECTFEISGFW